MTSARSGVAFTTPPAADGPSTARCYVLVTPDGERTMNTYLGAAQNLTPADLDEKQIAAAGITYLEGYLWDPPQAKEAFRKAATIAHGAGRKVALTLSDAFCVGRYRDEFLNLMRTGAVDLIFANESELKSLYETADFDTCSHGAAQRREARRGDAQREGLRGHLAREQRGREGRADRQACRCHRRGRSVRRGIPRRTCARSGSPRPPRSSARSRPPK